MRNNDSKLEVTGEDYQAQVNLSPLNQRIVIKNYQGFNLAGLREKLVALAQENDFTKIWAKIPCAAQDDFRAVGFETEAIIDQFYPTADAATIAYYLSDQRRTRENKAQNEELLTEVQQLPTKDSQELPKEYQFKVAENSDIPELAQLYAEVFSSYPYPIDQEEYLKKMMDQDVIYGMVYQGSNLVAAAAAETILAYQNAEMTDFATLPQVRGQGLASYLLQRLEEELKDRDYRSLYTIARGQIYGVNKIFSQAGYQYKGTLIKNCNIAGGLEDMNLWCKVIG
ncbi:putative beta-lysine N-acetyltransferase [Halanaerobaculum tunisiense]